MTLLRCLLCFTFLTHMTTTEANTTTRAGDILQIAIPAIAFGTTFYKDDETGRTQFYKSFGSTFAATHALKKITNKPRPDNSNNQSFPSGHTSAAFQGAAFIHFRYGFRYAIPAYLGASFVGYSRYHANKHDYADILAGAALGTLSSWYFTQPFMEPFTKKGITLTPLMGTESFGLSIRKSW